MQTPNGMVLDFKAAGEPGTRAEFSYHMTPATPATTAPPHELTPMPFRISSKGSKRKS